MQKTASIPIDREHAERLARLARATNRSVSEVVRDAVDEYLGRHELDEVAWRAKLLEVVARLRAGVPPNESAESIELEITAAREEVQASRAAGGD